MYWLIIDKLTSSSRHICRVSPIGLDLVAVDCTAWEVEILDEDKWARFPRPTSRSNCRRVSTRRKSFCWPSNDGDRYKIVIFGGKLNFDVTILMLQWEFGKLLLTEQDWRLEWGNLDLWDSSRLKCRHTLVLQPWEFLLIKQRLKIWVTIFEISDGFYLD